MRDRDCGLERNCLHKCERYAYYQYHLLPVYLNKQLQLSFVKRVDFISINKFEICLNKHSMVCKVNV